MEYYSVKNIQTTNTCNNVNKSQTLCCVKQAILYAYCIISFIWSSRIGTKKKITYGEKIRVVLHLKHRLGIIAWEEAQGNFFMVVIFCILLKCGLQLYMNLSKLIEPTLKIYEFHCV